MVTTHVVENIWFVQLNTAYLSSVHTHVHMYVGNHDYVTAMVLKYVTEMYLVSIQDCYIGFSTNLSTVSLNFRCGRGSNMKCYCVSIATAFTWSFEPRP